MVRGLFARAGTGWRQGEGCSKFFSKICPNACIGLFLSLSPSPKATSQKWPVACRSTNRERGDSAGVVYARDCSIEWSKQLREWERERSRATCNMPKHAWPASSFVSKLTRTRREDEEVRRRQRW
jgi:hypothetical protein